MRNGLSLQKKWIWIPFVQCIVLLCCLVGLVTPKQQIDIGNEQFQMVENEEGQVSFESSSFALKPGIYKAVLHYQTEQDCLNVWTITGKNVSYRGLLGNTCMLYSGLQEAETMVWVKESIEEAQIRVTLAEGGSVSVLGAQVAQSKLGNIMWFTFWLLVFGTLDGLYLSIGRKWKEYDISDRTLVICLGGMVVLASVPLFSGYVIAGADTVYHLLRVEGIKEGLLSGQFPVRIQPGWLQGHGYATGIFYCDTFLYLPALLRIMGFPMGATYLFYKFLVNCATVLVAYFSFSRMFQNRYIGVFGSALYTLNMYRFICMYLKDHLGQYTAMIFLPLLFYGLWRLLTEDTAKKEYKNVWLILVIAMTGIIQCHVLTCELAALFGLLLCLIYIRNVCRKETLLAGIKAVGVTILINAWFLVSFLDYMMHEKLIITSDNVYTRTIQGYGSLVPQLLGLFHFAGSRDSDVSGGMAGEIPFSLGIGLIFVLVCFWYVWYCGRLRSGQHEKAIMEPDACGKHMEGVSGVAVDRKWAFSCAVLGILCLWMSSVYFPWDLLHSLGGVMQRLISALQYPTRLLEMAALFLTVIGCITWDWIKKNLGNREWKAYVGISLLLVLLPTGIFFSDLLNSASFYYLYDNHGMGNSYLSGREYLPVDTDESLLKEGQVGYPESVTVESYQKKALQVDMMVENAGVDDQTVQLPMLYYRGYQAEDVDSGTLLQVAPGENHVVSVRIPGEYKGHIKVGFVSPWYYRVSEVISLLSLLCLAGLWMWKRFGTSKAKLQKNDLVRSENIELQRKAESV